MPHCYLTLSSTALRELVAASADGLQHLIVCPAGLNCLAARLEWLVHRTHLTTSAFLPGAPRVVVVVARQADELGPGLDEALLRAPAHAPTAFLALGIGPAAGLLAGLCRVDRAVVPLAGVAVAGSRLPRVELTPARAPAQALPPRAGPPDEEVWSRSIGALGAATWRRLSHLHVAIVGCGRSGSLAATALRRLGVRRLTLVDPDHLELHNLGEMDAVGLSDQGRPKVEAVARALATNLPGQGRVVEAVAESVLSLRGLAALKPADLVIGCADRSSARLATTFLAALYLKPLLDVGTGVFGGAGSASRQMGADVRLVLPGRCLLCLGGLADPDEAQRELLAGPEAERTQRPWHDERAGSLSSLNGIAVHLGLRLLEDLAAGLRPESTWLHLEMDSTGIPTLEHREPPAASCRLCLLTGTGDMGVGELRGVLAER